MQEKRTYTPACVHLSNTNDEEVKNCKHAFGSLQGNIEAKRRRHHWR